MSESSPWTDRRDASMTDAHALTKSRIVVKETVYFQPSGDGPISVENGWSAWLATDEQPYCRRMKVEESWVPLDMGWLEDCSLIHLHNPAPTFQVNPTDEEKREASSRIVQIGVMPALPLQSEQPTPFAVLSPGTSMHLSPFDAKSLLVRCLHSEVRLSLTIIPR
jgi:hypothetical protein